MEVPSLSTERIMKDKYILLIEDNESVRDALLWCMEDQGYLVLTASNGQEAIELMQTEPAPALIILDIMMPIINGIEFRNYQNQHNKFKHIPSIILSARPHLNITLSKNESFFHKPFNLDELLTTVSKVLNN